MDGQAIGELGVRIEDGRVTDVKYTSHRIDERIQPDSGIAAMVVEVRKPFVSGQDFQSGKHKNPFNGSRLKYLIDAVIGQTEITLHRRNFSDQAMPTVIRGLRTIFSLTRSAARPVLSWAASPASAMNGGRARTDQNGRSVPFHADRPADCQGPD
ncbi:MAG: hypothetical protein NVSMB6_21440 [Burkholderiaceae bacterium]